MAFENITNQLNDFSENALYKTDVGTSPVESTTSKIINFYLAFTASIFFILIIYAGIMWMTAQGNEEQVKKAQKLILNSTIALAIIFFAYLIAFVVSVFLSESGRFQVTS